MRILIAGGTGFIGQHLTQYLIKQHHHITILGRDAQKILHLFSQRVTALTWQQLDLSHIQNFDAIINLSGENIGDQRWTEKRKIELLSSRVHPTKILSDLCALLGNHAPRLLSANGIGVYGLQNINEQGLPLALDENTFIDFSQSTDFLSFLGRQWEKATFAAYDAGCNVVNMRFGVVLDPAGGVLKKLLLPYKLGLGGVIASGQQPFCWVALEDLITAIDFILQHPEISGAVNITAPLCATQAEFAKTLAKALHRPAFFHIPGWLLTFMLGEMAEELLTKGQHVKPTKLLEYGFQFKFTSLNEYFAHLHLKIN